MKIIITEQQLDRLIPDEDIEFVKKWKEETGHYPEYRELQQSGKEDEEGNKISMKVGEISPNHSKKNITTKTYVEKHLGKFLKEIIAKMAHESDEEYVEGKTGEKKFVTMDGKTLLRSVLESLTYSIFLLEGVIDEIEIDSKKFSKTCHKEPDFLWENRKLIVEVAGMEKKGYREKLEEGKKCFESLGYKVIIIDARKFEKSGKYVEYYRYLCEMLGFTPKKEVIESPYKFLGYRNLTKQDKLKYIEDNINKLPMTRGQENRLTRYLNSLYGYGIKKYKELHGLERFRHSIKKEKIINFKLQNPKMSNKEIADHFGIHKNTVQNATKNIEGRKN